MEAEPASFFVRRVDRQSVAAHDHVARFIEAFVPGFGCLFSGSADTLAHAGWQLVPDAVLLENRARLAEGGTIGNRGPRADHVQLVAHNVGENQSEQRSGISHSSGLAALNPRDVLAYAIDLVDAGAAMQQQSRGLLFFG